MKRCFLPGLLSIAALGCVPLSTGRLESNRFQHENYPYAVFYEQGGTADAPMGPGFRVDRRAIDGSDRGDQDPLTRGPKNGEGRYTVNRVYDLDANGRGDFQRLEPRYDLLLEADSQDAAMWVSTFPLAERESGTALDVLAQRYVASMAGQGEIAPSFGPERTEPEGAAATAQVLDSRACSLSERDAVRLDATFTQNGQARSTTLVLIRTGYTTRVDDGASRGARYPVLMVLGILAHPDKRASLEPRFESLVSHTILGDRHQGLSMNSNTTCGNAPPAASGGEAPAQAAPPDDSPESQLAPMPAD